MKNLKKTGVFSALAVLFSTAIALALVLTNVQFKPSLLGTRAGQDFRLVLDSSNAVSGAGEVTQYTQRGGEVKFTYSGVSSSTGNHVRLNQNGYLVNKDQITSIESISVQFSKVSENSNLSLKTSYDGATWSSSWNAISEETYSLGSEPYFIQLTATGGAIDISSVAYKYSCTVNPAAAGIVVTEDDTWERVSSNSEISSGDEIVIAARYSSSWFTLQNSLVDPNRSYWLGAESITLSNSNTIANVSESHNIWTVTSGTATDTWRFKCNNNYLCADVDDSGTNTYYNIGLTTTYLSSTCDWTLTFTNSRIDFTCNGVFLHLKQYTQNNTTGYEFAGKNPNSSDTYERYIFKRHAGTSTTTYDTPIDEIGFTATDSKASNYLHTDVYDSINGLTVVANYNDNTTQTLTKGGENGYSYVVKNSPGQAINSAQAFGEEGAYTVVVSYKNYIPVEIQINVGFNLLITSIEVVSTNIIFNTAQKLSDYTSGITANLTYNKTSENISGLAYSNFASKGITLKLLNPSGVEYSITSLFGTAGTWTIKIVSNKDNTVFGSINITVNAIPVTGISVTGSSTTLEVESTLQLTVSVTPNNATNQTVAWSSNHESIATVNTNGLVTGVSEGEARITATANDGSAVYGYIDLTITPKPIQTEFDADMTAGSGAMACTVDGNDGVKVGTSKATGTMTITVEAGATKLSFYAAGWAGTGTTLSLSGATMSKSSIDVEGDTGISGSGNSYTLDGNEADYYCETTLNNITAKTNITVTAPKRFALWNAKYYTVQVDPVYPTAISLTAGSNNISIGGTTALEVGYTPADTNVKNVTFSSNATSIATVSSDGIVTGVAAGTARITATAEAANNGTVTKYVDITVSAISVSSVSLNKSETELAVGGTEQLTVTISPTNATNQNVSWSSDATSVAIISNGLITAVAVGTATITVTTADGNKKATCTVTVNATSGGGQETFIITTSDFVDGGYAKNDGSHTKTGSNNSALSYTTSDVCLQSSKIQIKKSSGKLYNTSSLTLSSISISGISQGSFYVYGGNSQQPTTSVSESNGTYDLSNYSYFKITAGSDVAGMCESITITTGVATPTDPTSISLSPSSLELSPGGSKNLAVNYTPSSANQNKDVTWSRFSGSSNISVSSSGVVSVSSNASAGDTAVIRATLTNITSIYANCTVTVVEQTRDDQTILVYICGADLESNGQTNASSAAGYASGDITEILKVSGQPDDVNVVIETGGAKCWKTTHGINKNYLERYHVANKSLVRDSQETKASMGLTSTLQSFLTWGVQTYPADRISLILWNHGGAMRGVCYDENYSSNPLTNSEVKAAVANTFTSLGRSTSDKFEWIGYDACLMQVQDIAEFNSQYFNYMVASEESEAGAGWDYDNWLDDAYAKKTTPNILKAICDSFLAEQGSSSDQTLSYLDLSYMSTYKSAWETMSSTINSLISSYGKSNFQTLMKTCQYYGSDSDCEGYSYFGILDAKDVVNKIRATSAFNSASSQTSAVLTAFGNLVAYSKAGTKAGNSNGLCCFFPMKDGSGYTCNTSTVYTSSETNFTNWRSIVTSYGD